MPSSNAGIYLISAMSFWNIKISPQFLLTGEGKQEQSANKVTSGRLSEGKSMDEKMDLISGRITALFPSPFF